MRKLWVALLFTATVFGADLPAEIKAKFVKIIASTSGVSQVLCKDAAVASSLGQLGIAIADSKIAWASTTSEAKTYASQGKLVICSSLADLPAGGAIAVVEEGGKPAIYLHMGNIAKSGVTLSDSILKIGKRL